MSTVPSADAKAVVRAIEALTTQIRRALTLGAQQEGYALAPPVVDTDDAPTTGNGDGPRCVCGDPIEPWTGPGEPGWIHRPGSDTPCTHARRACDVRGPWGDAHACVRPRGHTDGHEALDGCEWEQAPAADERQAERWTRREPLLVLLTRLQRGRTLTPAEANTLRHIVETEMRDNEQLLEELRKAKRAADLLADSHRRSEQAEAAIERVRWTLQDVLATFAVGAAAGEPVTYTLPEPVSKETFERWFAALDGTEQPTTEALGVDTATLAAIFEGFGRLLATSSRDWGQYAPDAWLYAVILGWDCEQEEHDETCTHGAMEEMQQLHGWDDAAVAKARKYRAAVRALIAAEQPTEQP